MIKELTPAQVYIMHAIIGYACLIFAGVIGLHRFYFGRWITGILYICTGGFCMIGVLIDVVLIPGWIEEHMSENE